MNPDDLNPTQPDVRDHGTQFISKAVVLWFVLFWICVLAWVGWVVWG